MVRLLVKEQRVFLSFTAPIRQHDELEGVGIINIAIRQEDVERYARLTANQGECVCREVVQRRAPS